MQTAREKEVGELRSIRLVKPIRKAAPECGQTPANNRTNNNHRSPCVLAQIRGRREL